MYYDDIRLTRPFKVIRNRVPHVEHDVHLHDCLELCVVLENTIRYRFGDATYIGNPGDVFVCRPFEPHWAVSDPACPESECILLLFSPSVVSAIPQGHRLLIPFYTNVLPSPFFPAHTEQARTICETARKAVEAKQNEGPVSEAYQYKYLLDMLLTVFEYAAGRQAMENISDDAESVVNAVSHMLQHFRDDLAADEWMKQSRLGRTTFYKSFRALTGTSPNEFLHRLRIQAAMHALTRSARVSMTEIAYDNGFPSLSTFNKQFKRHTNMTPSEYRNKFHS